MFQVYVTTEKAKQVAVGPKSIEKGMAEQLAAGLRQAIATKRITGWTDPQVVQLLDSTH